MKYYLLIFILISSSSWGDTAYLNTYTLNGSIEINNWKSIKNRNVVRQDKDFSCGAASIATVLSEFYNRPTTEQEILSTLDNGDNKASFADMEKALPQFGFKGVGLATSWEQLTDLQIPVILYVKQRKQDHFTVISGITKTHVKISDPSLGNRILTRGQFREIWETRDEKGFEGKMLAILPLEGNLTAKNETFFTPPKFSHVPTDILTIRDK